MNSAQRQRARRLTRDAIRRGTLVKPPSCQRCGNAEPQVHHPDYSKPLEIEWLCVDCHKDFHFPRWREHSEAKASRVKRVWESKPDWKHLAKRRQNRRSAAARRKAGLCWRCGETRDPNSKAVCSFHMVYERRLQRGYTDSNPQRINGPGRPIAGPSDDIGDALQAEIKSRWLTLEDFDAKRKQAEEEYDRLAESDDL